MPGITSSSNSEKLPLQGMPARRELTLARAFSLERGPASIPRSLVRIRWLLEVPLRR
jgi:hypothetical protein